MNNTDDDIIRYMKRNNKSTACGTNVRLSGAIILLKKFKFKRGITPKVMSLVLQLYLVMITKYSKFGTDTFITFLSNELH